MKGTDTPPELMDAAIIFAPTGALAPSPLPSDSSRAARCLRVAAIAYIPFAATKTLL